MDFPAVCEILCLTKKICTSSLKNRQIKIFSLLKFTFYSHFRNMYFILKISL